MLEERIDARCFPKIVQTHAIDVHQMWRQKQVIVLDNGSKSSCRSLQTKTNYRQNQHLELSLLFLVDYSLARER